jgi:membrane protein
MKRFLHIVKTLVQKIDRDDCFGLAAEMAYNLALAIFPAVLLFVSFLSLIQTPKTALLISDFIGMVLPQEVYQPIDQTIEKVLAERRGGIFTFSLIFSFFSMATVFTTVMKAMERIYNMQPNYGFFRRQMVAVELVLLVSVALGIVFSLIIFGAEFEKMLEKKLRMYRLGQFLQWVRFPIAFLVMTLSALIVYKFSLRVGQKLPHVLPGAMLMALLWILVCVLYGDYLKYQYYGQGYTVLAKGLATLVWLYACALIFLIGAEVNWLFYSGTIGASRPKPEKTLSPATPTPERALSESTSDDSIIALDDMLPLSRIDLPLPTSKPPAPPDHARQSRSQAQPHLPSSESSSQSS